MRKLSGSESGATFLSGERSSLSRRRLTQSAGLLAGGLAVAGAMPAVTAAHQASPDASPAASPVAEATPDPNATFETISISREDYLAKLKDHFKLEDPGSTGGDVIQVFLTDLATVNPLIAQDLAAGYIIGLVFEGLAQVSPIDGTLAPSLADSWEISSDGLRYRFHLNPNATWHDGKPVTADDVIATYDALLAPDSLSANRATILSLLASYTKLDDHTVELTSHGRIATFLDQVATVSIMAKHIWDGVAYPDWPADPGSTGQDPKRVIGSGPFTFVEWVQNDHCTVARNDNYWLPDQKPVIDKFIYRVVADASSAQQALLAGEVDINELSSSQIPAFIKDNPDFTITSFATPHMYYYITNLDESKLPFFVDVRVRQALVWALDRDLIASQIFNGYAVRADGSQPPVSPAYAPDRITSIYTYDPEKAKSLLDEAGWTVGDDGIRQKDGKRFSVEILYTNSSVQNQQIVPYMQDSWKEIGVELTSAAMPFPTMLERLNKGDFMMSLTGFSFTPDGNQGVMYRCDSFYPAGFNIAKYCNPEYDKLDDEQQRELDPEKRKDLMIEAANILAEDLPNVPLVFDKSTMASDPRLHNYYPTGYFAAPVWQFSWVWIEQ
ncbi:MAG TPA: ABC transporter substrate-binding protein [Thermomicrobiales bacterium]|nr:ABC transporter substrate-binding protein [Thermomicrobiales bacterium]